MNASHQAIGQSFIELQAVDSTNNYATALVTEGLAQHGTAVFAHRQTAGRGQRNKEWITGDGANIAMSVILFPSALPLGSMFSLSMAVAVGVHRFFSGYAGEATGIKWPNDLYWNDRKAGGILIENGISATSWKHAVVGIGINVNQEFFADLGNKAVSLRQITGSLHHVVTLAKVLCTDLQWAYDLLLRSPSEVAALYHQHLYKRDLPVRLKKGARVFQTTVRGVNGKGQLITQGALEELFDVGEIEWLDAQPG